MIAQDWALLVRFARYDEPPEARRPLRSACRRKPKVRYPALPDPPPQRALGCGARQALAVPRRWEQGPGDRCSGSKPAALVRRSPPAASCTSSLMGPLLSYETRTAFFLEASFLGVPMFGWKRVSPRMNFFATCMATAPERGCGM